MKRNNIPRGRFDNRGQQMTDMSSGSSRGLGPNNREPALMTENVQLRDLDLELALLKRKREIIEQQQILMDNQRFSGASSFDREPRMFGQQQFNEPLLERTRGFAHLYNVAPRAGFDHGGHGTKRPVGDNWQNTSTPKRFSDFNRVRPVAETARPHRPPGRRTPSRGGQQSIRPLMSIPSQSWQRKQKHAANKSFQPTKVTKPKRVQPPNKLNTYPVTERRSLIDQVKEPDLVFSGEQVPSKVISGRLELALGNILKDLREKFGTAAPYVEYFEGMSKKRLLKQAIRERIRNAMVGKVVGPFATIMAAYREMYPLAMDEDIFKFPKPKPDINKMSNEQPNKLAIKPIETGDPERYFRLNFNRLLKVKLHEMFSKLHELYIDEANCKCDEATSVKENESTTVSKDNSTMNNANTDDGKTNAKGESGGVPEQANDVKMEVAETDATDPTAYKNADDKMEVADTGATVEDPTAYKNANANKANTQINEHYDAILLSVMRRRLPTILPKFKEHIVRILNIDKEFAATKAAIELGALQRADKYNRRESQKQAQGDDEANTSAHRHFNNKGKEMFFVKIQGRPFLPKKQSMQNFLNEFRPKTIKKHRGIHNLLFVGFDNKEKFDAILATDMTKIGNSTLHISVSVKKPAESTKEELVANAVESDPLNLDDSLDSQITDLLTSIREEEEKKEQTETESADEEAKGANDVIAIDHNEPAKDAEVEEVTVEGEETVEEEVTMVHDDEIEIKETTIEESTDAETCDVNSLNNGASNGQNALEGTKKNATTGSATPSKGGASTVMARRSTRTTTQNN